MREKIKEAIEKLEKLGTEKEFRVISHFDTDGITSAAIFCRALARWGKNFSVEIVKGLDEDFVRALSEENVLIFLDLASGSLDYLRDKKTEIFIFDHHEVVQEVPGHVHIVNPSLEKQENVCSAAICYLFARELNVQNKDLANLAILGMVGDVMDKHMGKVFSEILQDADTIVKKGLLLYPSTRPLDKALEFSSQPYIPGVSGSRTGVLELLRDAGITNNNGKYKALYELTEDEMGRLITAILLKNKGAKEEGLIGNLFLLKFFNKLEDARELSALVNACSRMDCAEVALGFCMGNRAFREEAEKVYITYKQSLVAALKYVSETQKLEGRDYMIINARDQVKDTIIGTVASILSHSPLYKEGLVIVALSYNQDKIKVSARIAGRQGRNVRDILHKVVVSMGGEVGGHPNAAGCLISKEKESEFLVELQKILDIETVKV